ncbi:MAG: 2-succinylbenzoate--CoA ligase [bacterium]|nr:2-succinylbenzoate--CoA ligase [bacterium]
MIRLIFQEGSELEPDVREVLEAASGNGLVSLMTSGTTGAPKTIPRDLTSALEKKKPGKESEKWLLTYHPRRWAGISVILHVLKAGATLCVPRTLAFTDIVRAGIDHRITHLSLTPSMFRNLLMNDPSLRLKEIPVEQLTFGGEAATQSVLDSARRIWPNARVSHVYASTETGDICSVSDGLEGIPAQKLERFTFNDEGELFVEGHATGDIWERRGDRYYFVGRVQEIINVGGNKVSPLAVEEFAIRCGVRHARAFAIPSGLMGSLVGLEYVGDIETKELVRRFREGLPKFMCPAQVTRLERIELSDAGKTKRLP